MKKVSLDTWIQLLGMFSVVAGLVFVGIEMRQTQRIAIANLVQARAEQTTDRVLTFVESAGWETAYEIDTTPYSQLTEEQKWLDARLGRWGLNMQSYTVWLWKQGLISKDRWAATIPRIQQGWDRCDRRIHYDILEPAFEEYLATIPDNCQE